MNNDLREDIFDTVLASVFAEYMNNEAASMPSKEELDETYPAPKNGLRKIKREVKKNLPRPKAVMYFQRVAVVFLAAVTLFTGVMALSTEVRSTVLDTIVQWFDKFASLSFGDEPAIPSKVIGNVGDFEIGYLPEGMELVSESDHNELRELTYFSENSDYIIISISPASSTGYAGDIELSQYDSIMINDISGYIFYNAEEKLGSVFFEKSDYAIMISCILEKSELIKVAENIK